MDHRAALAQDLGRLAFHPLEFVHYAFRWGEGELAEYTGPDEWQRDFLLKLGEEVQQRSFVPGHSVRPIRFATTSGHGVGKSALVSWLTLWIMATRPNARGRITANSLPQLHTTTWSELAKWKRLCLFGDMFDISTTRNQLYLRHNSMGTNWRVDGLASDETNSEAFAGMHNSNSTPFYIFDEASAIPAKIWEVSEGGTTDGEPMWFAFGNPTRSDGRFYDCFNSDSHRWTTFKVDSRKAKMPNKELIDEWIDKYGIDSDFVKVRVLGEFPSVSSSQLIGYDLARSAFDLRYANHPSPTAPVIIGVDPAWMGDDRSVVVMRQGLLSEVLFCDYKVETSRLGDIIAHHSSMRRADAVFIDVGMGNGVIDYLRSIGHKPIPVNFGSPAIQSDIYNNRRSEMWVSMKEWLESGGALPQTEEIIDDLCAPNYQPDNKNRFCLESKKSMRLRGLKSPDIADALALTFAAPVQRKAATIQRSNRSRLRPSRRSFRTSVLRR